MLSMKRLSPSLPAALILTMLASAPALSQSHQMPSESGQSAFAAIQEMVGILEADPATDWSKVNIEGLRQHLIDMDNVTLRAQVRNETTPDGMTFIISGEGSVRDSVQRMVIAHATTMNGVGNWAITGNLTETGANLMVNVPESDREKLAGLGFIGVMTEGMHHQTHHFMIASGSHVHN